MDNSDNIVKKPDCILVLCAHNDDQIIGVGGTLAKYAKENKKIITVVFSYGAFSHPHFKKKVIIETRVKESHSANKIICGDNSEIIYLGLTEGKFTEQINEKNLSEKIQKIITEEKPLKIFTHSIDDPHPDHQAVYNYVLALFDNIKYPGELYSFNVWNFFFNFRSRNVPRLVVDISDTFKLKIKAFERHKSQWLVIWQFKWNVYLQGIISGLKFRVKYAEVFYKIR
ncbi:MAG: PIG-L deacetylase family protein [archaeon]